MVGAVRDGLPLSALDRLIADGAITDAEIEAHFIPRRTLYARRQKGTLSREQRDLIVRLARAATLDPGGICTDKRNVVLNPRHRSAGVSDCRDGVSGRRAIEAGGGWLKSGSALIGNFPDARPNMEPGLTDSCGKGFAASRRSNVESVPIRHWFRSQVTLRGLILPGEHPEIRLISSPVSIR